MSEEIVEQKTQEDMLKEVGELLEQIDKGLYNKKPDPQPTSQS